MAKQKMLYEMVVVLLLVAIVAGRAQQHDQKPAKLPEPIVTKNQCNGNAVHAKNLFQLVNGREQSNKGAGAIADAMFYARALGRVLVEPAVKDSRCVDPATPGAMGLSKYYNLTLHRLYVPIMPLEVYRTMCARSTALLDVHARPNLNKIGGIRLQSAPAVKAFFFEFREADVIQVRPLICFILSFNVFNVSSVHNGTTPHNVLFVAVSSR